MWLNGFGYNVQKRLWALYYFRDTETHKHTRVRSQVTTRAHACTGTHTHVLPHKMQTHTRTSPDVARELSLIVLLSFASQTAQSVYPYLDKYTLARGGVYFTRCVFWFNRGLWRPAAHSFKCIPLGSAWPFEVMDLYECCTKHYQVCGPLSAHAVLYIHALYP